MWLFLLTLVNLAILATFVWLWPEHPTQLLLVESVLLCLFLWLLYRENKARKQILAKLTAGFASLKDNDFAVSLPLEKDPSHNELIEAFNQVVENLRLERQAIYQRELLLDKMVNASNVVSVLLNHRQQLVYLNQAGKSFLANTQQVLGLEWQTAIADRSEELAGLLERPSGVITLTDEKGLEQDWLLSSHYFKLHGAGHQLILLKPITNELQAQETQVWKKVIRVINHELNNSLAPISSMCHSGKFLADQLAHPQLNRVFDTISNRIVKLSEFINSYSHLARIHQPQLQEFDLVASLHSIQSLYEFELTSPDLTLFINADSSQLEQVFINLLKNAKEASSSDHASAKVQVQLKVENDKVITKVIDAGSGMTEQQLMQAFLPSYTTKPNGSGIGLAVCKEIIENHKGQIELLNNPKSGVTVEVTLPIR